MVIVERHPIGPHHAHLIVRRDPEPPLFPCSPPRRTLWICLEAHDSRTGRTLRRQGATSLEAAREIVSGFCTEPPPDPVRMPAETRSPYEATPTAFGERTGD